MDPSRQYVLYVLARRKWLLLFFIDSLVLAAQKDAEVNVILTLSLSHLLFSKEGVGAGERLVDGGNVRNKVIS